MSDLGKKGEMKAIELIAKMGQRDNSHVDLVRYTITNAPDNGHDIGVHHTSNHFDEMLAVSRGELTQFSNPKDDSSEKIKTRIDVKNENNKVTKPVAEKFVSDIKKHPDCQGHLLVGNNGLTKGAEQILFEAAQSYPDKKIGYISNAGLNNLMEVASNELERQYDIENNYLCEIDKEHKID